MTANVTIPCTNIRCPSGTYLVRDTVRLAGHTYWRLCSRCLEAAIAAGVFHSYNNTAFPFLQEETHICEACESTHRVSFRRMLDEAIEERRGDPT
jgi:hypothetical protein